MNPALDSLQPYPFQKLAGLLQEAKASPRHTPINLSIGEPKHPTPEFIQRALTDHLSGLASYPATAGTPALRGSIAAWLMRRHQLSAIDPAREVLPVNGSREALFAFAQTVVDRVRPDACVVMPNPFYQIYEGAALLAGARPEYLNLQRENGYRIDFDQLAPETWTRVQLLYLCSPANPTGTVMDLDQWAQAFALSDRHGFVIASDECYSEIYYDEDEPPLGALAAAHRLGRSGFPRLVVFSSLSKRSSVPGMRSGFVAGDARILERFLLYRTYHGCAMSPAVQAASQAAWEDEAHVVENRRLYREKFRAVLQRLRGVIDLEPPAGAFYLWLPIPGADTEVARALYEGLHLTVLPGSYLARERHGCNPGRGFLRIALVSNLEECTEAARRLTAFLRQR
jgi:N-succinyldiaminopimelate aminotransferase